MGGRHQFFGARLILLGYRHIKFDPQRETFTLSFVERAHTHLGAHLHDPVFFFANMA